MNSTTEIVYLKHGQIVAGVNPRKRFDPAKMEELGASLEKHGFLASVSHLLVRPIAGGWQYELIFGGRRWQKAGELIAAGKLEDRLPAMIEEMSDAHALELQLIEVLRREGLTKLEEAESLSRMLDLREAGELVNTRATVAEKIGCTEQHISDMLQICRLRGTPAGEALEAGEIGIKHARALAKVRAGTDRDSLTRRVLKPVDGFSPMPYRQLEQIIRSEYMIELRGADFDQASEDLYPVQYDGGPASSETTPGRQRDRVAGGSCLDCPFNSKNSEEAGKLHMCMNPECFREKKERSHARWMEEMTANGCEPLTVEAATKIFDVTGKKLEWNSGLVELAAQPSEADFKSGVQGPAWKRLIKGQGVPVIVAKDGDGKVHELARHDLALAAARKNEEAKPAAERIFKAAAGAVAAEPVTTTEPGSFDGAVNDLQDEEEHRREAVEREKSARIRTAQIAAVVEASRTMAIVDEKFWGLVLDAMISAADELGVARDIALRNGMPENLEAGTGAEWLLKRVPKMSEGEMRGLFVEIILAMWGPANQETELPHWAKLVGVSLADVRKRVERELRIADCGLRNEKNGGAMAPGVIEELLPFLKWTRLRGDEEAFEWNEHGACMAPDKAQLAELPLCGSLKLWAAISVARDEAGWHSCYAVGFNKGGKTDLPSRNSEHAWGTRLEAIVEALRGVQAYVDEMDEAAASEWLLEVTSHAAAVQKGLTTKNAKSAKKKGGKK